MSKCIFCGGKANFAFRYNHYDICHCEKCHTSFVEKMPTQNELSEYYNGFKYEVDEKFKQIIVNENFRKWFNSFNIKENGNMLDIGGGNGYFCLAYEKLGLGKATYLDLDKEACSYVSSLNISNVINSNISDLPTDKKYDFIYCRHVIEHLIDPRVLIDSACKLLADDCVFILQFPNGMSWERVVDPIILFDRLDRLNTNNPTFSLLKKLSILFSKKTSFDLHPKRHLWAISKNGFENYLQSKNIEYKIKTVSIDDPYYSPYAKRSSFFNRIIHRLFSLPYGGAHLVVEIRNR